MNKTELINDLRQKLENTRIKNIQYKLSLGEKEYEDLKEKSKWTVVGWCEFLGIKPEFHEKKFGMKEFYSFPRGFYNTKLSSKYIRLQDKIKKALILGKTKFLEEVEKKANNHFLKATEKLADRIEDKGLDMGNLTVSWASIGINIEATICDGEKSVQAYTIVASGPIQKPHYRYLVR